MPTTMTRLLALALLLSGCEQKPTPSPTPGPLGEATQSIATINGQAVPCRSDTSGGIQCGLITDEERLVDAMQLALVLEGMRLDRVKQDNEIAALKRRVGDLEWKLKVADAAPIPNEPWTYIGDGAISMSSERHPIKRFHYGNGGAWCNVWADEKGIHWEECK